MDQKFDPGPPTTACLILLGVLAAIACALLSLLVLLLGGVL